MDSLILPLVDPETTIRSAIDQMTAVRKTGVILKRADGWVLLYARQLLEARDRRYRSVGQIEDGVTVLDAEKTAITSGVLDRIHPKGTWKAYEELFNSIPYQHVLAAVAPKTATVMADRDILAYMPGVTETGSIDLPVVDFETTIENALGQMHSLDRHAVIVENPNASRLLHEPLLRQSSERGMHVVGTVAGGWPVQFVTSAEGRNRGPELMRSERPETLIGRYPSQRIFAALNPKAVRVVTAHEGLAGMLSGQYGGPYKCNGKKAEDGRPHYFPDPYVQIGDRCPYWPECNVDGARTIITYL